MSSELSFSTLHLQMQERQRQRQRSFAPPQAVIEPAPAKRESEAAAAATATVMEALESNGSNDIDNHPTTSTNIPIDSVSYHSDFAEPDTTYLWRTPPGRPAYFTEWMQFPSTTLARRSQQRERARQAGLAPENDDDPLGGSSTAPHYPKEFGIEQIEKHVEQHSKHTETFVREVHEQQSLYEPLRDKVQVCKQELQTAVDNFCDEFHPPINWEPNPFVRAQIARLKALEAAMVAAKAELDAALKKGNDLVLNMGMWDCDPAGQKRRIKLQAAEARAEMAGYGLTLTEFTRMGMKMEWKKKKKPFGVREVPMKQDVEFVNDALARWKKERGIETKPAAASQPTWVRERVEAGFAMGPQAPTIDMMGSERLKVEEIKKAPSWFLALEARGVIRSPPYEVRGGAVQRYQDFTRWLEYGDEWISVSGVIKKRWWFGGDDGPVGRPKQQQGGPKRTRAWNARQRPRETEGKMINGRGRNL